MWSLSYASYSYITEHLSKQASKKVATFNSNFSYIPTSKVKVDLLGGKKKTLKNFQWMYYWTYWKSYGKKSNCTQIFIQISLEF